MIILNYRSSLTTKMLSDNKKKDGETSLHIKLPNILSETLKI